MIIRAPGRVNIIGEHTDYNEGWVMPGAMSLSVYILIERSVKGHHHWVAESLQEEWNESTTGNQKPAWFKYIEGTLQAYEVADIKFNILIGGDLPVGAGVSSSSALICGLLLGLKNMFQRLETKEVLALLSSHVEREIIGLQGGIMDQFAIMLSKEKQVMMLDCRKRTYKFLSAQLAGTRWVLLNTRVSHHLIESDYNTRAEECAQAVSLIQKIYPVVRSLRDVTVEMLLHVDLPPVLLSRTVYVIQENKRVHEMASALKHHDAEEAGKILKRSHKGLREKYEVSCAELDHLADYTNRSKDAFGGRMMGGGFGGCVLCLVKEERTDQFIEGAVRSYKKEFGVEPEVILFQLANGAEKISYS